jgi:hypothetical protein
MAEARRCEKRKRQRKKTGPLEQGDEQRSVKAKKWKRSLAKRWA